jgi:protein SFI1
VGFPSSGMASHTQCLYSTEKAQLMVSTRSQTLFAQCFFKWRARKQAISLKETVADEFRDRHLGQQAFQQWRDRKKKEHKRVKQARIARRWFLKRECWGRWRQQLEEKARLKRLEQWNMRLKKKYFLGEFAYYSHIYLRRYH